MFIRLTNRILFRILLLLLATLRLPAKCNPEFRLQFRIGRDRPRPSSCKCRSPPALSGLLHPGKGFVEEKSLKSYSLSILQYKVQAREKRSPRSSKSMKWLPLSTYFIDAQGLTTLVQIVGWRNILMRVI